MFMRSGLPSEMGNLLGSAGGIGIDDLTSGLGSAMGAGGINMIDYNDGGDSFMPPQIDEPPEPVPPP